MQELNSHDKCTPDQSRKIFWPPSGSMIMSLIWTNICINSGLIVFALHPSKNVKKTSLLIVTLIIFNLIFYIFLWAKLQLRKRLAKGIDSEDEDWTYKSFYSALLITFIKLFAISTLSWCVLITVGFDKLYAFPMALGISLMVFLLIKKETT